MRRALTALALLGVLTACATPAPVVEAVSVPCPPSASAAPEAKPPKATLTSEQQAAIDRAVLGALGVPVFIAREAAVVAQSLWGDRQAERVRQTREWCLAITPASG